MKFSQDREMQDPDAKRRGLLDLSEVMSLSLGHVNPSHVISTHSRFLRVKIS